MSTVPFFRKIEFKFGLLFLGWALLSPPLSFGTSAESLNGSCFRQTVNGIFASTKDVHPQKIEDLDTLLQAFTKGLKPDLTISSQRDAFEIYRRMRFGNPNTSLNAGSLDEIAKIIKTHPELEKEPFRNQILKIQERSYPVTKELSSYLDSQVATAGQTRSNLFQVEANSGYWKKILQYEEPETPKIEQLARDATDEQKTLYRERAKQLKEENNRRWLTALDEKVSPELRVKLQDQGLAPDARAKELYQVLNKERDRLIAEGKDIKPVSQAMVDLIHTIGYHDPAITKALKSVDGLQRLKAYHKILDERDRFAMDLGFEGHFDQVLQDISKKADVIMPTGVPSINGVTAELENLEKGVKAGSKIVENAGNTRTIRHLSLVESPFRSCLGGSDCSSRTYFTRALDPNYHYFTITDETGVSSGHITIVLGEGNLNGKTVKMAFVDKVQNVPNTELPEMMEGVRRSVEERGYKLAIPDNVGDHNGLSNEDITRSFVDKNIKRDPHLPITNFKPHYHTYNFKNAYSRAEAALPSHGVLPLQLSEGVEISPGEIVHPWKTGDLDLNKLVQASIKLKNSEVISDRLRYIPSMKAIKLAGLKPDPEFEMTLAHWMKDGATPFQIRKQALLHEWTENSKPLSQLLPLFTRNDQVQLLQNFMDTPRFRELILKDKKNIPDLIITARENKKTRETLMDAFAGTKQRDVMDRVLDAKDITDEKAAGLVRLIKTSLGSTEIEELLKIKQLAHGTSLDSWFNDALLNSYVTNVQREPRLGQAISRSLGSHDPVIQDFGRRLLAQADDPKFANYKVLKAFKEITEIQKTHPESFGSFKQASMAWMKSETVNPELKAKFLLSQFGSKDKLFHAYQSVLPKNHIATVMQKIDAVSNVEVFEHLATKERLRLDAGKIESFEFESHRLPAGGKKLILGSQTDNNLHEVILTKPFEIQATPTTQLQWSLVMGENPSHFKTGGETMKISGREILMNPNHPVEQVSYDDIQKYISKLNQTDSKFNYRLPTEAEWEYSVRAGTDTEYSFGNDASELDDHAWSASNAGNQTHAVASLKPNANGLYDMHGNVWEWVQDWRGDFPKSAVDPTGPAASSGRVLRGGGWFSAPQDMRSAQRAYYRPGDRSHGIGFRLVRTPRIP